MSKYQNLEIFQKSTKAYELKFKNKYKAALNITGWTIYFTVKEKMQDKDADAKIKKIITIHLSAIDGKTLIELSSSDTDLLGNYYYSFDFKNNNGKEGVLFLGRITFKDAVLDTRT